jgi:hypothetical protein
MFGNGHFGRTRKKQKEKEKQTERRKRHERPVSNIEQQPLSTNEAPRIHHPLKLLRQSQSEGAVLI